MSPWVALLVGFAAGGLLRRAETMLARRNARQWRWSSQRWQAETADAYHELAFLAQRNEELRKAVDGAFDVGWDAGWQDGVGIRVDLGGIDP